MTDAEKMYAIFSMLLGATVFGYIVGSLASIMQKFDAHAARYKEKMDEVKEYIKERGLSRELGLPRAHQTAWRDIHTSQPDVSGETLLVL